MTVYSEDVTLTGSPVAGAAARFYEVNLIADPLYGYIEITKSQHGEASETTLLDTPWLQRLKRIRQLQSAWWVFPSAEHSRFVHLLGAMHLSGLFARRIDSSLRDAFPDAPSPACVEETLRLAGLLHDIGHGPFGHFFDREVLSRWNIDHEDIGRYLVTHDLAGIISSIRSSPSGHFAPGESIDPIWISWVMAPAEIPGYTPPRWLRACKPILCGPATADNLDYVPRDAYMCGVSLGPVDVQRLIHYSFIADGTLALHAHASGALEMFLTARLYMYTNVYHHRTGRRFDLSLHEIFADTVKLLLPGHPLEHLDAYQHLTDWSLLEAVQRWQTYDPGTEERRLADQWVRIMARELPWHLVYETFVHANDDVASLREKILRSVSPLPDNTRVEVDVFTASIAPNNPMSEDGMVAIFDPLVGKVQHSRAAELVQRLPQYSQVVRVFTDNIDAMSQLHADTVQALTEP